MNWVSVKDRMPQCNMPHENPCDECFVLVLTTKGAIGVSNRLESEWSDITDESKIRIGIPGILAKDITHWAVIPDGPEGYL